MTENGIRIPLWIDGAMLLLVIFLAGGAWVNIETLAAEVEHIKGKELPERVARIEAQVKANGKGIDEAKQIARETRDLIRDAVRRDD